PRLAELRHSPEERKIAVAVTRLIEGSELATTRPAWRGQDPYTLRCIPQVLGATAYAIATARTVIDRELNAVSDNPLVFEKDEFISGGNFHGQHLALALDSLALGVHYLGAFAERRVSRLVHPSLNRGLPPFLAPEPGLSNGLMIPQYVAASLVNENVTLVQPASAVSIPTSADQEDFVSMGAWAGAKLRRILQNVRRILAIEWMVGGQAVELRRPKRGGKGTELALRTLRESVAPWTEDRSPASDLEAIERRLTDGSLLDPVRKSVSIEL
ncbi:MAG: aromatic amino acid lyase, partial [Thermoplasmata archaeon]